MKRTGNLWQHIANRDALYKAYVQARRGKRGHYSCHQFERRLGAQILSLEKELISGVYKPKPPNRFYVYEPKKRLIEAPAFRDLVVQHALYAAIMPVFERKFIDQSFACRIGLGTHKAADYIQAMLQSAKRTDWILKVDCKKFFYSLDHEVLKRLYRRHIKCTKTLRLMDLFVSRPEGIGVPIGNLMSQIYALIYLNPLDHFTKRELGAKWYARYVDDLVLLCASKEEGAWRQRQIEAFLWDELFLGISKWSLQPVSKGVDCFGYRTWASRRFIRKRALYVARKSLKCGKIQSFISCLGHAKRTASLSTLIQFAREHNAYLQIPKSLRPAHHLHPANKP